mmetsp:Transcript_4384/g.15216  ORF Transcript_4384/g.15216 Transcript_4384/m.15216 type:complete len:317 (+) Transcript_4384:810-1760(+)
MLLAAKDAHLVRLRVAPAVEEVPAAPAEPADVALRLRRRRAVVHDVNLALDVARHEHHVRVRVERDGRQLQRHRRRRPVKRPEVGVIDVDPLRVVADVGVTPPLREAVLDGVVRGPPLPNRAAVPVAPHAVFWVHRLELHHAVVEAPVLGLDHLLRVVPVRPHAAVVAPLVRHPPPREREVVAVREFQNVVVENNLVVSFGARKDPMPVPVHLLDRGCKLAIWEILAQMLRLSPVHRHPHERPLRREVRLLLRGLEPAPILLDDALAVQQPRVPALEIAEERVAVVREVGAVELRRRARLRVEVARLAVLVDVVAD